MARPTAYKDIELRYNKPMALVLPELFDKLGNERLVAEELKISHATIVAWIDKLSLQKWTVLRPREEKKS